MGDRGNVFVVDRYGQDDEQPLRGVYLYTHWGGSELHDIVKAALARGSDRWDDGPYLARIIFCEMVAGDVHGTTGYGIALSPPDNEHAILVVDVGRQEIRSVDEGKERDRNAPAHKWSFREFVDAEVPA